MPKFLKAIERPDLFDELSAFEDWHKILARPQSEAKQSKRVPMQDFRANQWIAGGLFGDVIEDPGKVTPLVTTGDGPGLLAGLEQRRLQLRPARQPARPASPPRTALISCARGS